MEKEISGLALGQDDGCYCLEMKIPPQQNREIALLIGLALLEALAFDLRRRARLQRACLDLRLGLLFEQRPLACREVV